MPVSNKDKGVGNKQKKLTFCSSIVLFPISTGDLVKSKKKNRTMQFCTKHVAFWKDDTRTRCNHDTLEQLMLCDGATLRINNHNNSVRNHSVLYE